MQKNLILFSAIWGIAGCLEENGKSLFNEYFTTLIVNKQLASELSTDLKYGPYDYAEIFKGAQTFTFRFIYKYL